MAKACLMHQKKNKYAPINVVIVDGGGNTILINRQTVLAKPVATLPQIKRSQLPYSTILLEISKNFLTRIKKMGMAQNYQA